MIQRKDIEAPQSINQIQRCLNGLIDIERLLVSNVQPCNEPFQRVYQRRDSIERVSILLISP